MKINVTPLTGGTSKLLNFWLPPYENIASQDLYLYYKVVGSSGNNNIVAVGAYIEATKKIYCDSLDFVPPRENEYLLGATSLHGHAGNGYQLIFSCSNDEVIGSLIDYEVVGENNDPFTTGDCICYATYRHWLGYGSGDGDWPNFVFSKTETTRFALTWHCEGWYGTFPGGSESGSVYMSFNNAPLINSYTKSIEDVESVITIDYVIPEPAKTDYISFGVLDSGGNLLSGYRIAPKDGTSYSFSFSELDLENIYARYTTQNTANIQLGVRYKNLNGDVILVTYPMFLSIRIVKPSIECIVKDLDSKAVAATGNENVLVRYESDIEITVNPVAYKGAKIASYYVKYNNETYNNKNVIKISDIKSYSIIEVYAKDSRGNSTLQYVDVPLVEYFPVTCNVAAEPPNTDGELRMTVTGKYWDGNFGARDNHINLYYKYTSNIESNNIDWTYMQLSSPLTIIDGNYTVSYTIQVPNHADTYTIQVRAMDEFRVVESNRATVKSTPVFDWGQNDFNFNVPVTIQGDLMVTGQIVNAQMAAALEDPAADYVVQAGTSGIWTYRLWNSGVSECWGTITPASHSIGTAWGALFVKDNAIPQQNYPFQFVSDPVVSMTLHNPTGNCWAYTGTPGGVSKSPAFGLARGTSGTVTVGARIMAIGRWK
jgi:hypothetical protein